MVVQRVSLWLPSKCGQAVVRMRTLPVATHGIATL